MILTVVKQYHSIKYQDICSSIKQNLHNLLPTLDFRNVLCSGISLPCCIRLSNSSPFIVSNSLLQLHFPHSQFMTEPIIV